TRAVRPDSAVSEKNAQAIAEICVHLDGLPLALELAAAQTRLLPPPILLRRLREGFPSLASETRDVPARHHTLRATLDWSYGLLDEAGQSLLRAVAVFAGGWSFEATEAIWEHVLSRRSENRAPSVGAPVASSGSAMSSVAWPRDAL